MDRRLRIGLAQLAPAGGYEENVARTVETLAEHPELDLLVFPELFLSGYAAEAVSRCACTVADLTPIREVAREHRTATIVGFAERDEQAVYDSVACVDSSGALVATYRKTHLFGDEHRMFTAGESLRLANVDGTRVGLLICFDMEFPEPARALAAAGAELLVTCSANMAPYGDDHLLASRARALDNRRPHVYVNRVGAEDGAVFVGGSRAVDATGCVVVQLAAAEEVRECEVALAPEVPSELDYLSRRREGLPVSTAAGDGLEAAARGQAKEFSYSV